MHSQNPKIFIYLFISVMIVASSGCGRPPSKYVYEEIVIESPLKTAWQGEDDPHAFMRNGPTPDSASPSMPMDNKLLDSVSQTSLIWAKPESWQEYPGSGFRLVTFKAGSGEDAIECSIVSLSGAAGGIEANLLRWMTQVNLQAPPDAALLEFLKNQGAYVPQDSIEFIDFTKLQKDLPATSPSMYVSIFKMSEATVFVKITGSIQAIAKHKKEFLSLSESIKLKE